MPDAHDPYLVSGRFEIANLLQTLQARQCLLLMRIPGRPFNSVTSVLHVDAQAGQVVLDAAQDDTLNQRLADVGDVAFDTSLDNISICLPPRAWRAASSRRGRPCWSICPKP